MHDLIQFIQLRLCFSPQSAHLLFVCLVRVLAKDKNLSKIIHRWHLCKIMWKNICWPFMSLIGSYS